MPTPKKPVLRGHSTFTRVLRLAISRLTALFSNRPSSRAYQPALLQHKRRADVDEGTRRSANCGAAHPSHRWAKRTLALVTAVVATTATVGTSAHAHAATADPCTITVAGYGDGHGNIWYSGSVSCSGAALQSIYVLSSLHNYVGTTLSTGTPASCTSCTSTGSPGEYSLAPYESIDYTYGTATLVAPSGYTWTNYPSRTTNGASKQPYGCTVSGGSLTCDLDTTATAIVPGYVLYLNNVSASFTVTAST
jgi:hypothetical protein